MIEKTNYTSYNDLALLISFRARQEFGRVSAVLDAF